MDSSKGFTLVELSVAFVIIVLLLAGAMIPLSTQIELRSVADTQRSMEQIREAIVGFSQANGRLPCPANGALAAGATGAGTELFTTPTCNAVLGVVPWATLGVPEADAWGRRFTYRVSPAFADDNGAGTWATVGQTPACGFPAEIPVLPAAPTSFALCTLGNVAVFTRGQTNTTATTLGAGLTAVIVSHGRNGLGAWQSNGTRRLPNPVGDELINVNGGALDTPTGGFASFSFYSRSPTPSASGCVDPVPLGTTNTAPPCEFDDIVVAVSSTTLIARMVAAGRLP